MMEFIKNSAFFGAMISLIAYEIGLILKKKFKMAIFNPLLISIICVIGVLLLFHIDYDDYNLGADPSAEKKSQGSGCRNLFRNAGRALQCSAYGEIVWL